MATKEDILEQIVEEYLIHKGFFVRHNIKFLPRKDHPNFISNQDSNHSDIDVLGYHPKLNGPEKVIAVSCKSWQGGFDPRALIDAIERKKIISGREAWKGFRELCVPKWSEAFIRAVQEASGAESFIYMNAVTKLRGDRLLWEGHVPFMTAKGGNPLRIVTFPEMVSEIQAKLTKTLAATEVGRMLQLVQAAGMKIGDPRLP